MNAGTVLQAAVVAGLRGDPALAAVMVFDAAPVRAALPYAIVEEPLCSDWSAKDWSGREARLAVLLHDAGERPVRLRGLAAAVEDAVATLDPEIGDGWRVASLVFVRGRIARGAGERWISASEFRVRMRRL